MLSCLPFSFFAEEVAPPAPAHPVLFVMRNGRYEPQYLMPVMPRQDASLEFEGFVPSRWSESSSGLRRAPAPDMRQVALRKSRLSIRRDSVQFCVTLADAAPPPGERGEDGSVGGCGSGGGCDGAKSGHDAKAKVPGDATDASSCDSFTISFVFDSVRPGTLSIHLRVEECEERLAARSDEGASNESPQDRRCSSDDSCSKGSDEDPFFVGSPCDGGTISNSEVGRCSSTQHLRKEILLVPLDDGSCSEVYRCSFEPGMGQVFQSPPFDLTGYSPDALFFDPERPNEIPMAIRIETEPEADEIPMVFFTYAAVKGAANAAANGGSPAHKQATLPAPGQALPSQILKQRLQFDGQCFNLLDVFGCSLGDGSQVATPADGRSECVICLSEPRDTAVLPCRHMCFCSHCAGIVRLQCERCPVCRQRVGSLMQFTHE